MRKQHWSWARWVRDAAGSYRTALALGCALSFGLTAGGASGRKTEAAAANSPTSGLHLYVAFNKATRLGTMEVYEGQKNATGARLLRSFPAGNRVPHPEADPAAVGANGPFPPGTWVIPGKDLILVPPPNPTSMGPGFIVVGAIGDPPRRRSTGIHGGRRNYKSGTLGCIRLNDHDMQELIDLLRSHHAFKHDIDARG